MIGIVNKIKTKIKGTINRTTELNKRRLKVVLHKKKLLKESGLEHIHSCYLAWSSDPKIQYLSSSGGFCKSMLSFLINTNEIDEAIIARNGSEKSPLSGQFLSTSDTEILTSPSTNSVYTRVNPIPLVKQLEEDKQYAMTALGCHLRSVRNLQKKGIAQNVKIVIGLLCSHSMKIDQVKSSLASLDIDEASVKGIEFRGKGWPGSFTIHLRDGSEKSVPFRHCWADFKDPNILEPACRLCYEIPRSADFIVCDPWAILIKRERMGKTLVLCMSKRADDIIRHAKELGYLKLSKRPIIDFLASQMYLIQEKTEHRLQSKRVDKKHI